MEDGTAGALLFLAMQTRIATQPHMHIVRLLDSMKKIGLILLAGFCLSLAPAHLAAQSSDPSEAFLKAYMTSQQGEKLEHDNQFQPALAKFRFAGALLEELKKTHADWQPAIVDFRSRKIGESILRVQGKLGTQKDLAATSAPPPVSSSAPVLPEKSGPAEPSVEVSAPRSSEAKGPVPAPAPPTSAATDAVIKDATKKLQDKVDQLQVDLDKTRTQYDSVAKEKEDLNGRLQETNSKLEKAQADLEKTKGAGTGPGAGRGKFRFEAEAGYRGENRPGNQRRQAKERAGSGRREAPARTIAPATCGEPEAKQGLRGHRGGFALAARGSKLGSGEGETDRRERQGDDPPHEGKRDAPWDCGARAAGGSPARAGQETHAGRIREIADQVRYLESADRASGPAGDEAHLGGTCPVAAASGGYFR